MQTSMRPRPGSSASGYMTGKSEEHRFGPEGQIMLIEYHEAAYLKG